VLRARSIGYTPAIARSRGILERLDLSHNSDDFVFDNQMLAQIFWHGSYYWPK